MAVPAAGRCVCGGWRITTGSEFVDVLWEVFGELGTSHAYAHAPDGGTPAAGPGLLGADIARSGDAWRVTRVVHGDTSDPRVRAPLAAPGAGIAVGDMLLAVDGRPVGPDGPGPLLMGAAGKPAELTVAPADGSSRWSTRSDSRGGPSYSPGPNAPRQRGGSRGPERARAGEGAGSGVAGHHPPGTDDGSADIQRGR
jgi:hypothetical protein